MQIEPYVESAYNWAPLIIVGIILFVLLNVAFLLIFTDKEFRKDGCWGVAGSLLLIAALITGATAGITAGFNFTDRQWDRTNYLEKTASEIEEQYNLPESTLIYEDFYRVNHLEDALESRDSFISLGTILLETEERKVEEVALLLRVTRDGEVEIYQQTGETEAEYKPYNG